MHKFITDPSRASNFRTNLSILTILFSSLLLSSTGKAADPVGVLKFARGDITIQSAPGETRKAAKGDTLMQNELVVTGVAGIAVIQLNDNSRMTLRPNSEFRVELLRTKDNSNDSSSQPSAVLSLLRGGLRLVTGLIGKINPTGYRLNTPVATIGIRGTEFNTRICSADCAAEESQIAGDDAAGKIREGLYVNVDEGRIFLENEAQGGPLDLGQGESGYVADLTSLSVKLALVPAFLSLDKIPSPSQLNFDNIQMPDDALQAIEPEAGMELAEVPAAPTPAAVDVSTEIELSGTYAGFDISGTYEIEVSYGSDLPRADRKWYWGTNPDIEFALTQDGDKMNGVFSGDLDGSIKGKIDDNDVTFEFVLEARGGETKSGEGIWTIQDDGSLKGEFTIRDQRHGFVRGHWTLTRVEASGGSAFGFEILFILGIFSLIAHPKRRKPRLQI